MLGYRTALSSQIEDLESLDATRGQNLPMMYPYRGGAW